MNAAEPRKRRGADLLLLHCAALTGREERRPSALERLEALVGDELAASLLARLGAPRTAGAGVGL